MWGGLKKSVSPVTRVPSVRTPHRSYSTAFEERIEKVEEREVKQIDIEDGDFYYDDKGRFVMTSQYHLKRGHCCGNGCKHCPYDYENVREPGRSRLLARRQAEEAKQQQ
eukprot:TRINITY_DN9866_c0_g1_i1.p1 TRINITY_DN9866_c0_g1~~TRINITY_DN9866_c0_g1_i1.p1  ORF type:complete len:109 (+),score=15.40 TRINITY_DN9866_c0_g1_i1:6-332(+)